MIAGIESPNAFGWRRAAVDPPPLGALIECHAGGPKRIAYATARHLAGVYLWWRLTGIAKQQLSEEL